jgi:hypothetical protein
MNFIITIELKKCLNYSFYWHCLILIKCWNDNLHIIIRVSVYFMYLDCCFVLQSLIIFSFVSFDHHMNLITWAGMHQYWSCMYFLSQNWHVLFWLCEIFDCFSFSRTVYILPFVYIIWIFDMFYILWAMAPCTWIEW